MITERCEDDTEVVPMGTVSYIQQLVLMFFFHRLADYHGFSLYDTCSSAVIGFRLTEGCLFLWHFCC